MWLLFRRGGASSGAEGILEPKEPFRKQTEGLRVEIKMEEKEWICKVAKSLAFVHQCWGKREREGKLDFKR